MRSRRRAIRRKSNRRRLRRTTAAPCLFEAPMWPNVGAKFGQGLGLCVPPAVVELLRGTVRGEDQERKEDEMGNEEEEEISWSLLWPLDGLLRPSGTILESSWVIFGPSSWRPYKAILAVLDAIFAVLKSILGHPGRLGGHLGPSLGRLEALLGKSWAVLEKSLGHLGLS